MLTTILTGIVAYASTSIDCLILLTLLFGLHGRHAGRAIYWGDFLGTTLLLLISGACAYPLRHLPQSVILGILGIFPILIGLKTLLSHPAASAAPDLGTVHRRLPGTIALLIVSTGADNISVYIPLFTQATTPQVGILLVTLYAMLTLFYLIARGLARFPNHRWLQKNERLITGTLYLLIGCSLLFKAYI
ncbi:cadmium resistance transporter [Levilactobacillus zymae]|uniref:cadmium resistance transporter n=1 Tax=Levilactobacillus zymae TaxID=267363 RepID=UPI0028B37FEA|nr:cadmium resistance transporter [Levilactobacillus zymae]MDT6979363.1 cadmium resistance transporter [Levilactobacillus zymae]